MSFLKTDEDLFEFEHIDVSRKLLMLTKIYDNYLFDCDSDTLWTVVPHKLQEQRHLGGRSSFQLEKKPNHLNNLMRKPTICICENKGAAKIIVFTTGIEHSSTFQIQNFQALAILCLYTLVCVKPVHKSHCWFSHDVAHL